MQIAVAVEPIPLGGFRAESAPPFTVVAEGSAREEAVEKVRDELNKQLEQGKVVMIEVGSNAENPWLKMAGIYENDPHFDLWQECIAKRRQQADADADLP